MDKPLVLYPGVLSPIPGSSGLLDETLKPWPYLHLSFWWDVIHKLAHSQQNLIFACDKFSYHMGAQWLSCEVLDSRPRVAGFEPYRHDCVVSFVLA